MSSIRKLVYASLACLMMFGMGLSAADNLIADHGRGGGMRHGGGVNFGGGGNWSGHRNWDGNWQGRDWGRNWNDRGFYYYNADPYSIYQPYYDANTFYDDGTGTYYYNSWPNYKFYRNYR